MKICRDWGKANGVEVNIDFIAAEQLIPIAQAESRAQTGHDVLELPVWGAPMFREMLEPLDEVVEAITQAFGELSPLTPYLARLDNVWRALPTSRGALTHPLASRLDLFKAHAGIDLLALFPIDSPRDPALIETWTYDTFLDVAKKLHAAGYPFGAAIAPLTDAQGWLDPLFLAFGAVLVNERGEIAVNSDQTRQALEYLKQLTAYMPPEIYAWDNASNNRWLISGKGAAVVNPPSAWVVAKKEQPQIGAQIFHHDLPKGPQGRFRCIFAGLWGLWSFAQNKAAAKDLMRHLYADRETVDSLVAASQGYDTPMLKSYDHPIWAEAAPPAGTLYNYPIRGDEQLIVPGYPAPPAIAGALYPHRFTASLVAKVTQAGESIDNAIAWAEKELEGMMRS
jgi:ABC-type glycerol-3-phosphate transport system substrate-binding protein